jgi:hypothetical protein
LESGKFGLVRNNGRRFHEGIDIKSFLKTADGAPADQILAFMGGTVVYVNAEQNASNYGRYLVLKHTHHLLTLYAHLASIGVSIGQRVKTGETIGILGTTSNIATIPNSRAHLHFELDFQIGDKDHFATWYSNHFDHSNPHGEYNGFNLIGIDPIRAIQKLVKKVKFTDIMGEEKEAATIKVFGNFTPDFVKKYAVFFGFDFDLSRPVQGWWIRFSWFGLPIGWEPVYGEVGLSSGVELLSYRPSLPDRALLRDVLRKKDVSGAETDIAVGSRTIHVLTKMGFDC